MYKLDHVVKTSQLGPNQKMRITNMINLMLDCEMLHIDSLTVFNQYLKENNIGIFLTFRQIDIYDYPKFKDNLVVVTAPYETKAFLGFRNTVIYDNNNNPITTSYSLGNFVNLTTNQPSRIPDDVIKTIISSDKYPMEYTNRKITVNDDYQLLSSYQVNITKSYIDLYVHVNNMFYIDFCLNQLPDDFTFDRIRSEYKTPLKLNDVAEVMLYSFEDIVTGKIYNQNNQLCAVIEFSTKKA